MNILEGCQRFYFGEVVYNPGGSCGPRVQQNLQLVVIHSGNAEIVIDGHSYLLSQGSATLLVPNRMEFFQFSIQERTHHSWCEAVQPVLSPGRISSIAALPFSVPWTPVMDNLLRLGLQLERNSTAGLSRTRNAVAIALIQAWLDIAGWPEDNTAELIPQSIRKASAFIDTHYHESIGVEAIVRASGVSQQHLARLFREHFKQSPSEYLWNKRLQQAANLTQKTGLSFKEIAEQCGFQSPYHFSRKFASFYGCSPRAWRKKQWES